MLVVYFLFAIFMISIIMPEISGKPSPGGVNLALNPVHTYAQGA